MANTIEIDLGIPIKDTKKLEKLIETETPSFIKLNVSETNMERAEIHSLNYVDNNCISLSLRTHYCDYDDQEELKILIKSVIKNLISCGCVDVEKYKELNKSYSAEIWAYAEHYWGEVSEDNADPLASLNNDELKECIEQDNENCM